MLFFNECVLIADMDIQIAFGQTIREIRGEKNLTQADLAATSNLDESYISGIERAVRNPTLKVMEQLAIALGLETWVLLRFTQDKMNK